jgi:hypothetical protein
MKRAFVLKPVDITPNIAAGLEKRGLIRLLRPARNVERCRDPRGTVGTIYVSDPKHGSHKLISVRCTTKNLQLNSHPGNEEFILIHPAAKKFSPLYLVIALRKRGDLERKIARGTLCEGDFLALRMVFNDPALSVFTMRADTVHCEIAAARGGEPPVFFVAEPSKLAFRKINMKGYSLKIDI